MPHYQVKRIRYLQDKARRSIRRALFTSVGDNAKRVTLQQTTALETSKRLLKVIESGIESHKPIIHRRIFNEVNAIINDRSVTNQLLRRKDAFGSTLTQSINNANKRLRNKVKRLIERADKKSGFDAVNLARQLKELIDSNPYLDTIIDYRIAQAHNYKRYSMFFNDDSVSLIDVLLSDRHKIPCICDTLTGTYSKDHCPIPPFHLHCECYLLAHQ